MNSNVSSRSLKSGRLRLSLVAADPQFTTEDYLDDESTVIRNSFEEQRAHVEITNVIALTEDDLLGHIREVRPQILHFTGHGSPLAKVSLRTVRGPFRRKTAKSLARLLRAADVIPQCVVLNNCSLFRREDRILSVCENFIRMQPRGVFDYALGFARTFYNSLVRTERYDAAFEDTVSEINELGLLDSVAIAFKHGEPTGYEEPVRERVEAFAGAPAPAVRRVPAETERPRKYSVWFGTNRRPTTSTSSGPFGSVRDDKLHYGRCEVSIPKCHKLGSLGTPWWKRWPVWHDDRLKLLATTILKENNFWSEVQQQVQALAEDERSILLYIHGYNVSFEAAAVRAAQLGADLNVAGPCAFFSWPSKGRVMEYAADIAAVEGSEGLLQEFLEKLSARSGADRIHIILHSMGNRAGIRAFQSLVARISTGTGIRFGQIFLAAPDIDVQLFKRLATAFPLISQRTTMYISARDRALWGSGYLHDYPRAGYKPPTTVVQGVDTVEVSNLDLTFLGHSYIGAVRPVLSDMHALMLANTPPSRRMGLESITEANVASTYWRIRS